MTKVRPSRTRSRHRPLEWRRAAARVALVLGAGAPSCLLPDPFVDVGQPAGTNQDGGPGGAGGSGATGGVAGGGGAGTGAAGGAPGGGGIGAGGSAGSDASAAYPGLVLAESQGQTAQIAVDAEAVYWVTRGPLGSVHRCGKDGSSPLTLASGQTAGTCCLALDSTHLYWTSGDGVRRVPKTGGSFETVVPGSFSGQGIALEADKLYWNDPFQHVHAATLIGTGHRLLYYGSAGHGGAAAETLEMDAQSAFNLGTSPWVVRKIDDDGICDATVAGGTSAANPCPAQTLATPPDEPTSVRADASYVFFTTMAGEVIRVPRAGGTAVPIASGQANPYGIALDGDWVYWVNRGNGSVLRVAKSGGSPEVVAIGLAAPEAIAIDAEYLFISDPGAGKITRIDKPVP